MPPLDIKALIEAAEAPYPSRLHEQWPRWQDVAHISVRRDHAIALGRIALAAAEYELLRCRDFEDETYEEWAAIATQLHANLLVALRNGGLLP